MQNLLNAKFNKCKIYKIIDFVFKNIKYIILNKK